MRRIRATILPSMLNCRTALACLLFVFVNIVSLAGAQVSDPLPGMPSVLDSRDIYHADRPNLLSPAVANFPARVYVPNTQANTVSVIDQKTFKVIDTFHVGKEPQHVVPSWDLKTLWVLNDMGNSVTAIDPSTGKLGKTYPVEDPYNMYYTPDGKYAIVVAEALQRLMATTRERGYAVRAPDFGGDY